jgi:hypothetical protein
MRKNRGGSSRGVLVGAAGNHGPYARTTRDGRRGRGGGGGGREGSNDVTDQPEDPFAAMMLLAVGAEAELKGLENIKSFSSPRQSQQQQQERNKPSIDKNGWDAEASSSSLTEGGTTAGSTTARSLVTPELPPERRALWQTGKELASLQTDASNDGTADVPNASTSDEAVEHSMHKRQEKSRLVEMSGGIRQQEKHHYSLRSLELFPSPSVNMLSKSAEHHSTEEGAAVGATTSTSTTSSSVKEEEVDTIDGSESDSEMGAGTSAWSNSGHDLRTDEGKGKHDALRKRKRECSRRRRMQYSQRIEECNLALLKLEE